VQVIFATFSLHVVTNILRPLAPPSTVLSNQTTL
jgi:hypothetical protein